MKRINDPKRTYFLESTRLGFRTWSEADIELAWSLWGDPEVTGWIGGPFSRGDVADRLRREIDTADRHGIQYWPIFLLADSSHVGCCGLRPYRPEEQVLELGVHLRRPFWGQGLAPEAGHAVIRYAFEALGARAIFAGHHPRNEGSRRLLQKLGFVYTHDEFYPPTGLQHPSYLLSRPS